MRLEPEPECCGVPMVHNSYTEEYECADAYFFLVDEGALGDPEAPHLSPDQIRWALPTEQIDALRHWRQSRRPDTDPVVPESAFVGSVGD